MEIMVIVEIVAYLAFWHVLVWFIQWIDYKKDVKEHGQYYADQIRRYL